MNNYKKSSPLKSFLTTASVVAISIASTGAMAMTPTTSANMVFTDDGTNWNAGTLPISQPTPEAAAALENQTSNIALGVDAANGTVSVGLRGGGPNAHYRNFDLNGKSNTAAQVGILEVSDAGNYSFTSLIDNADTATAAIDILFADTGSLAITTIGTTTGGTNSVLRNVDFNGNNGTLTINNGIVAGEIDNTGDVGGVLIITGDTTVSGSIGNANSLNLITVSAGAELTAKNDVNATNIDVKGTLIFENARLTGDVEFTNKYGVIEAGRDGIIRGNVTAAVDGMGTYSLGGNFPMDGNVGAMGTSINTFNVGANGDVATQAHNVYAKYVNIVGNSFTVSGADILSATEINIAKGATLVAGGNGITAATTKVAGTLTLGAHTLNGDLQFTDQGVVTTTGAGHVSGNVTATTAGYGSYTLAGNNAFMAGNVGAADLPIGTFKVGANANVSTAGHSVYAQNVVVEGSTFIVNDSDILSATNITLNGDLRLESFANPATKGVVIAGGSILEFVDQPSATPGISTTSGFGGTIVLDSPGSVSQNLLTPHGQISLGGNTTLVAGGNLSAATIFVGGDPVELTIAAPSNITTSGAGIVNDISITIDDRVVLTLGDGTIVNGAIDAAHFGKGAALRIASGANGVTLAGQVGGLGGVNLDLITIDSGAKLILNEDVYATNTTLEGELNIGAGKVYDSIVTGMGTISFLGDPASTWTKTANFSGLINFYGAGTVDTNLTTSGVTKLGDNITLIAGGAIGGGGIDVGAYTLTQNAGSVTGSIYSRNGTGTYITKVPGTLSSLGKSGNALGTASISGGVYTYSGNMYVGNFEVDSNTTLDTSSTGLNQTGNIDYMEGSTINLGSKTQTVNGTVTLGGSGTAVTINTSATGGNISGGNGSENQPVMGNIVGVGSKILAKGHNIAINITADYISNGTTFTLLTNADGMPNITNLSGDVLKSGAFLYYVPNYDSSTGNLTFLAKEDSASVTTAGDTIKNTPQLQSLFGDNGIDSINKLIAGTDWTGDALAFRNEILSVFADPNATPIQLASASLSLINVLLIAYSQINQHKKNSMLYSMDDISYRIGITAGSEEDKYISGIWFKGTAGNANQKLSKGTAGYKSTTLAATIGADTFVTDSLRIGIAGSRSDGKIKMKDFKSGDKIKSESWIFSLYGYYDVTDKIYTKSIASFAATNISSSEKKLSRAVNSESQSSYTSYSYALEAVTGYNFNINDNTMISPEVGLTVIGYNNGGYKETGGAYNRTIISKAGAELLGKVGANLSTKIDHQYGTFTPAIYANVSQYLAGKNPQVSVKLDGQTEAFSSKQKPTNKTMFHAGTTAMVTYGMMEYGASYDFAVAKKYTANTGSLKLRVNL